MGIVNKLRKQAENAERKRALMKEMCKRMCREREEKAAAAEARAAASERLNQILIERLGGEVEVENSEWQKERSIMAKYEPETGKTIFAQEKNG